MACPQLPPELWLEIFRHCEAQDLWSSLRFTNKQLKDCAEDVVCSTILKSFTIAQSFSLGAGTRHRWYDVRGSVILAFSGLSKHNSQYALFDDISFHPEPCHQRVWEKWNQICGAGVGEDLEWRITLDGAETRRVKMPKLVISAEHGAWCDWREMLDGYFGH